MARRDGPSAVGEGEFVVARCQPAPLLVLVEAALDDVTSFVVLGVIADRSAAPGTAAFAVAFLVVGFGDDRDNSAAAQVGADRGRSTPYRREAGPGGCGPVSGRVGRRSGVPSGSGTSGRRRLGRDQRALPAAARVRRRGGGSSWTNPLVSDRLRGQAAPGADSCSSSKPPVSRGRFVAC